MGDSNDIERLFSSEIKLSKFTTKRWVRVPDSNKGNYNQVISYNCRDHRDKLVAYHNGYIIVKVKIESTTGTALTDTSDIFLKNGGYSVIEDCKVEI